LETNFFKSRTPYFEFCKTLFVRFLPYMGFRNENLCIKVNCIPMNKTNLLYIILLQEKRKAVACHAPRFCFKQNSLYKYVCIQVTVCACVHATTQCHVEKLPHIQFSNLMRHYRRHCSKRHTVFDLLHEAESFLRI